MTPRLWQRQPGESPADFSAFAAYLRLKGRRSHRATAQLTGRTLGAIRRLSAQYNWAGRVAAFETRLADATQEALDGIIRAAITTSRSDLEQFRIKEFLLAHQVIHASKRWLELASDRRRRQVSVAQICRLTELAFRLACLATGMPFGDEPRRRPRPEDRPGYWTGPSLEEALQKIYGKPIPGEPPPDGGASVLASRPSTSSSTADIPPAANSGVRPQDSNLISVDAATAGLCGSHSASRSQNSPASPISATPVPPTSTLDPPVQTRCDAWSRLARYLRQQQK